ncbi:MAG: precorrin-3B C(17)-methyltransferase [Rhodospirillales bacterium]|nr:precorrin-3B C(17)-methyltransferase [Rhodospirillales bacterium]
MLASIALVVLDSAAAAQAQKLKQALPGSEIHGLAGRVGDLADISFSETVAHLQSLFVGNRPIIGFFASGILIRALAPVLSDKHAEPPVLAVSVDGATVVPLLGGHHGANDLAHTISSILGCVPAVTTAGDTRLGLALDAPPQGWRVANRGAAKAITAALLAGDDVALAVEAGDAGWIRGSRATFTDGDASYRVRVTDQVALEGATDLVLHPPVLALGVGCERDASPDELIAHACQTLKGANLAAGAVACVVSIDLKADEVAVHALASHLGVPVRFFTAEELEAEVGRLENPSNVVFQETGCHGVAEGAALAAVGAAGKLIAPKAKSLRTTCAIARADGGALIDPLTVGHPQGALAIVGIGPGMADWRTPQVTRALAEADDVVGYGLYLDLIEDVIRGKQRHQSELAQEEVRARAALDLAAEGRRVALVCSGDAGIYALATLVFELLDREDRPEWNRLAISVCPGVSAIQAAASRIGAPIGHDFCTISLSDLLTPWEAIQQRLEGAALGDFVVALYNPVSKRRQKHITEARDILLKHRPAETPVVLARNLGREGEDISVIRLDELGPDKADMLTLVLIGNSQSVEMKRGNNRWVYTPRGYAAKLTPVSGAGQKSQG